MVTIKQPFTNLNTKCALNSFTNTFQGKYGAAKMAKNGSDYVGKRARGTMDT